MSLHHAPKFTPARAEFDFRTDRSEIVSDPPHRGHFAEIVRADAVARRLQRLDHHRHRMRGGVDDGLLVAHDGDMAAPEHQVAPAQAAHAIVNVGGTAESDLHHVGVARGGNADRLKRDAILIELNPAYAEIARNRITRDAPLFGAVV